MATTGGHVWPAARRLLEYIEATKPPEIVNEGARILELGSGTGWMGMTLAANLPHATQLCVTEMEAVGALTWLRKNVARNEDDGLWRRGCVHVEACDWTAYVHGDEVQSPNEKPKPDAAPETSPNVSPNPAPNPRLERDDWDVLVGSDLVYNEDGVRYLPRVVRHFLTSQKRKTHFLYAHTKYRYELRDMALWKEFDTCGLEVEEVREEGAPSPPSSPEPLTQLFPEKRIAVLRITLRVAES
jgi:predicted nicotinamide N-methyase